MNKKNNFCETNNKGLKRMEGLNLLEIGEAIKIRRIKQRIHQTKLAEQLGISQTHLSNAENGRVMLSLKALLKLKRIFGCTLDELVEPENNENTGGKDRKEERYKLVRCDD